MKDIIQYLEHSVENVRGVDMVPLSTALQAIQLASSLNLLQTLEQTTQELYESLKEQEALGELGMGE
jgi:hypothetical protein